MSRQPSRRAVLGALTVVPAAGLIAVVPMTATASAEGAAWYGLKARYDAAKATADAFNRDFHDPAHEELESRCGKRVDLSFEVTALSGETARYWAYPPDFETVPFPPFTTHAARIKEAWERREALLAVWAPRLNIEAINQRSTQLDDRRYDLCRELIELPAPDLPALRWKIEELWGDTDGRTTTDAICMGWALPVIEDCRRLLGERLSP